MRADGKKDSERVPQKPGFAIQDQKDALDIAATAEFLLYKPKTRQFNMSYKKYQCLLLPKTRFSRNPSKVRRQNFSKAT